MVNTTCWVDCCGYSASSWGMCPAHREAWDKMVRIARTRLTGDDRRFEHYTLKSPSRSIQEVFGAKPDCIIWGGGLNAYGYGQFRSDWAKVDGGSNFAHLYAWVVVGGKVRNPDHETDHLCRFRPCANHEHLEQVSQRVNTLRGVGFAAENFRKTHCDNGHEFTRENTAIDQNGWRSCVQCNRDRNREWNSRPEVKEARRESYQPSTGVRGKGQYRAQREVCSEGHPLEGDNLVLETVKVNGKTYEARRCRTCRNANARDNHAKRTAANRDPNAVDVSSGEYVNRDEVAQILGIERSYVRTYTSRQKDFPGSVRSGRSAYYNRQEVLDWRDAQARSR